MSGAYDSVFQPLIDSMIKTNEVAEYTAVALVQAVENFHSDVRNASNRLRQNAVAALQGPPQQVMAEEAEVQISGGVNPATGQPYPPGHNPAMPNIAKKPPVYAANGHG